MRSLQLPTLPRLARTSLQRLRGDTPLMFALTLAWLAAFAWIRPLYLPDEGRYSLVAWEMARSGDWAVPTLDGLPFFHKPPLYYWLSAVAIRLFGAVPLAVRLPSILAAAVAATLLWRFLRRWCSVPVATWTLGLLATQPFFFLGAQFANLDMLVAACIGCTVLLAAHAVLQEPTAQARPALVAAYGTAALGVLAKGLIGIVLPALVLTAWLVSGRQGRSLRKLLSVPGIVLFAVVALPWFIAMQSRYPGFAGYFIVYHHLQRFAQGGFNNVHPAWYYPVVLLALALPGSLGMPLALRRRDRQAGEPSVRRLMWCWLGVIIVFFSLPQSKPVGYVMPALPPLAWLLAEALLAHPRGERWLALSICVAAVGGVGTVLGVAVEHPHSHADLGRTLGEYRREGEPVVYWDLHPYDIAFYGHLEQAPRVVSDWKDPAIEHRDDWRKELHDAARFAPERAASTLIDAAQAQALVCRMPVTWWVTRGDLPSSLPARVQEMAGTVETTLWRLQRDPQACARIQTPAPTPLRH